MKPELGTRLVAFDMDGTLIQSYMDKDKRAPYSQIVVLDGRREMLAKLHGNGVVLAIVTNQGGAAFGYQTVEEIEAKVAAVVRELAVPMLMFIALGHEKAKVESLRWGGGRRKPSPQMLIEAMVAANVIGHETVFVGDMPSDREAAHWAGCRYVDEAAFFA